MIRTSPHARLNLIAVGSSNTRIGTRKVRATISFVRNVAMVDSQISL